MNQLHNPQSENLSEQYSGIVASGWNEAASYDRLQYAGDFSSENISYIVDFVKNAEEKFNTSLQSRLDMRIKVNFSKAHLHDVHLLLSDFEVAAIFNPLDFNQVVELTICQNNAARSISGAAIDNIQNSIIYKLHNVFQKIGTNEIGSKINHIQNNAIREIENLKNRGFLIEANNFEAKELLQLWELPFGWSEQMCEDYIQNISKKEQIFGIRNSNNELVSAALISHGETSEWAVREDLRGQGLITPLLIAMNVDWVRNNASEVLYVHMRYDRSVSPAIKSGMIPYISGARNNILTNHVTVSAEEPSDIWNKERRNFKDVDASKLRSFLVGQLDPRIITPQITDTIDSILL